MQYAIQPNIHCENCIKCGSRPVFEQAKKFWVVCCPNKACKNTVTGEFIDIEKWNRTNKKDVSITADQTLKNTA